jgi:general secretion pathway protein D
LLLWVLSLAAPSACGQPAPPTTAPVDSLISLNFPDNVDLKALVDYVSLRLEINIVYQDDQLASQRVTIKAPTKIPVTALLPLLRDLLKMKGLALVDAEQPGWKRVAPLQSSAILPPAQGASDVVTAEAFSLKSIDPQRADTAIKPFLSGPTAASVPIPEQRLLLVTDFASNLRRVEQVIGLIDQPNRNIQVEFIPVKNADPAQLSQQVKQILVARLRAQSIPGQNPENNVDVSQDRRTGQLAVVGPSALVEEAARIIHSLDVPVDEQQSPVHFYKLANATATDVLETIRALEGDSTSSDQRQPTTPGAAPAAPAALPPGGAASPPGGALAGAGAGSFGATGNGIGGGLSGSGGLGAGGGLSGGAASPGLGSQLGGGIAAATGSSTTPAPSGLRTRNATVAADPNTNTLIVVAEPSVQKLYEQLIKSLDKRRPQVLLEATIVTIDTTHDLTFGVEVSNTSKPGGTQTVSFTNFGFSTPNSTTGQLVLTPGTGFNGVVIGSDLAQVVLRALATNSRAKVTSSPKILVNDNATGTLSSITEQPYTTTAIGTTIATTSFGGYAQAGTIVTLTPHISEADYLQLEYQVTLSSFIGSATSSNGVPPGIVQNTVQSKVTIPDGQTVVVGGLNQTNYSKAVSSLPIIDQIPVLNILFGRHDDTAERSTLFVFLRPIILRDDQFEDLKFLSDRDIKDAGIPPGMPLSAPLPIR